jgi:hypothetical protein
VSRKKKWWSIAVENDAHHYAHAHKIDHLGNRAKAMAQWRRATEPCYQKFQVMFLGVFIACYAL